jgi:hypothetical protein
VGERAEGGEQGGAEFGRRDLVRGSRVAAVVDGEQLAGPPPLRAGLVDDDVVHHATAERSRAVDP